MLRVYQNRNRERERSVLNRHRELLFRGGRKPIEIVIGRGSPTGRRRPAQAGNSVGSNPSRGTKQESKA